MVTLFLSFNRHTDKPTDTLQHLEGFLLSTGWARTTANLCNLFRESSARGNSSRLWGEYLTKRFPNTHPNYKNWKLFFLMFFLFKVLKLNTSVIIYIYKFFLNCSPTYSENKTKKVLESLL